MPRRARLANLLLAAAPLLAPLHAFAQAPLPPPAAAPVPTPAPTEAPPPDPSNQARIHFEKGVALFKEGAIDAALAELLQSRRLHPTKNATNNAAICLRKLQRFDEALALYEALLREFSDVPADMKTAAQREVVELRALVGTIEIDGAELGAAITLDGRSRGDYPPIEPLRVPSGSHALRVYKEGFEPFETRLDVAGGRVARVAVRLRALNKEEIGTLSVREAGGRSLEVLVDGVVVGNTPWEGPIAIGNHTVSLRGEGELGTQPASVPVKLRQTTALSLAAEALGAALQIRPTPAGASVAIDSVTVGRGSWSGRLHQGSHRIEIAAEGFLSARRSVSLERGQQEVVSVSLERDPASALWRRPARFSIAIAGAPALTPTFGGDIGAGCAPDCGPSRTLGFGAYGVFRGGYTLGSGFGFGVSAGYLKMVQEANQDGARIALVGSKSAPLGTVTDLLTLQGFLAGAWAGFTVGERFPLTLRLGAGGLIGTLIDSRTGTITEGKAESLGRRGITRGANLLWMSPEVRMGFRLGEHVELSAGIEALIVVSPSPPRWEKESESNLYLNAGSRGAAEFPNEAILGRALLVIAPGLGAAYAF